MRRFGLFALGSLGLFACTSLLGDFDVLPAEAVPGDDGGTSSDDGGSMADTSTEDAPPDGPVGPSPVPEVVAANQFATCATAVQEKGTPRERRATYCWGARNLGQPEYLGALKGDPMPMGFARPRMNKTEIEYLAFDQIYGAGRWFFGRAMKSSVGDRMPFAWGANDVGQAAVKGGGDGSRRPDLVPPTLLVPKGAPAPSPKPILGGGAAPFHGCFFDDNRRLYCWGQNDNCEVRSGSRCGPDKCNDQDACVASEPKNLVVAEVEDQTPGLIGKSGAFRFSRFAGGLEHSCVVRHAEGADAGPELVCWGDNLYFQTGASELVKHVEEPTPIPLPVGVTVSGDVQLAAGENHTCAVFQSMTLVCWGRNHEGQAAPEDASDKVAPTTLRLPSTVTGRLRGLALGGNNSCFIVAPQDSKPSVAVCFGGMARLWVDGSARGSISLIPGIEDVQQIAVGNNHACAIARDVREPSTAPFSLFCWGENDAKQVDPNDAQPRYVLPHRVELPPIPQ